MVRPFVWRDVSGTVGGGGSNGRWTVVSSDSHVHDCINAKIVDTEACVIHQALWEKNKQTHSCDHLMGVQRMLQ